MTRPDVKPFALLAAGVALTMLVAPEVVATFSGLQSGSVRVGRNIRHLREVLPDIDDYMSAGGLYEHFRGFTRQPDGSRALIGLAFLTTDVGARVTGYSGPIDVMVGIDLAGSLIGVKVVEHYEPYGARSIEQPAFRAQFVGKHVRHMFHVGTDIDTVSGATITVRAATDAIRRGSRRMIREFLREQAAGHQE